MDDHIKPEISTYLAGALTESRNRQIETHVASCEKCRTALARARNKQARVKREALKKASTEKMPNLFLARQGKESAARAFLSSAFAKKGGVLIIAIGLMYWGVRRGSKSAPVVPEEASDQTPDVSTATARATPSPVSTVKTAESPRKLVAEPVVLITPTPAVAKAEKLLTPATTPQLVIPKAPDVPKVPLILPVVHSWKGADSAIRENRVLVVRTQEGWQKLWAEMKVPDVIPTVDFTDKIVIAIYAGPVPSGSSIEIGKIEEVADAMLAPYRVNAAAAPVSVSTLSAAAPQTYPYWLAMVPRVDRKIKISRREAL